MNLFSFASVVQIVVLAYFLSTLFIDMFPWNNIKEYRTRDKYLEASVNGVPLLICIILFRLRIAWADALVLGIYGWFVFIQLWIWWRPYFSRQYSTQLTVSIYKKHFSKTYKLKFIPKNADGFVPDAEHITQQVLSFLQLAVTLLAVVLRD